MSAEMNYASLIVPVDELPPYDEYIEPFCEELLEKIATMQRKVQVSLKEQGIQVRKEVRSVWPDYCVEYKKLLVDHDRREEAEADEVEDGDEGQPLLGALADDTSVPMSLSTNGAATGSDVFLGFHAHASLLEEEVSWKVNFTQGMKAKDSKLFFFGSTLFRLSFGLNTDGLHYYIHISPAERLESDIRIHCKYRIHDPATEAVLLTQIAEGNYLFRRHSHDSAGIDEFVGPEVSGYLDGYKRLLVSVVVSTELGVAGEMLGLRLYEGTSLFT
jgi:hypothetical protein